MRKYLRADYLQEIHSVFPHEVIEMYDSSSTRDRVYSCENTILTMIYSATQADKTLQNAVNFFGRIHQNTSVRIVNEAESALELEKIVDLENTEVLRGPKKKYKLKIPKSKISEISVNTAAYSKARKRIDFDLLRGIFDKTRENADSAYFWYGMKTYITDGTYFQMQDTEELRKLYSVNHTNK